MGTIALKKPVGGLGCFEGSRVHVPGPGGGDALPMELRRGVAYDTELVAEVRRRLGEGIVDLRLASA